MLVPHLSGKPQLYGKLEPHVSNVVHRLNCPVVQDHSASLGDGEDVLCRIRVLSDTLMLHESGLLELDEQGVHLAFAKSPELSDF